MLSDVIRNLASVPSLVGYTYHGAESAIQTYPSIFSQQLALLRNLLIVLVPLVGLLWYSKIQEKEKNAFKYFKFLLLFFLAASILLLYFVNWSNIPVADIRDRILDFAFFPIAFFFSLGLDVLAEKIGGFRQKYLRNRLRMTWKFLLKPIVVTVFVVVMVVPSVMSAFPRFMYDTTYQSITISEFPVVPENNYALGCWIALHVNSSFPTVEFAGSSSSEVYVLGYGLFQGAWLGTLNETELSAQLSSFPQHSVFYVVNTYNLKMSDSLGQTINSSTTAFLNEKFYRVYDNGPIILFERAPTP